MICLYKTSYNKNDTVGYCATNDSMLPVLLVEHFQLTIIPPRSLEVLYDMPIWEKKYNLNPSFKSTIDHKFIDMLIQSSILDNGFECVNKVYKLKCNANSLVPLSMLHQEKFKKKQIIQTNYKRSNTKAKKRCPMSKLDPVVPCCSISFSLCILLKDTTLKLNSERNKYICIAK